MKTQRTVQLTFFLGLLVLALACDAIHGITLKSPVPYRGAQPPGQVLYPEFPKAAKWIAGQVVITVWVHNPTTKAEEVRIRCQWMSGEDVEFDLHREFSVPAKSSRAIEFAHLAHGAVTARCSGELVSPQPIAAQGVFRTMGKVWRTVPVPPRPKR